MRVLAGRTLYGSNASYRAARWPMHGQVDPSLPFTNVSHHTSYYIYLFRIFICTLIKESPPPLFLPALVNVNRCLLHLEVPYQCKFEQEGRTLPSYGSNVTPRPCTELHSSCTLVAWPGRSLSAFRKRTPSTHSSTRFYTSSTASTALSSKGSKGRL